MSTKAIRATESQLTPEDIARIAADVVARTGVSMYQARSRVRKWPPERWYEPGHAQRPAPGHPWRGPSFEAMRRRKGLRTLAGTTGEPLA